jgi:thioredoxin-related protein
MKIMFKIFLFILALQLTLQARVINIDTLIQTANETQKHLLVWLHKTDCGYCENMREFTLENEIIKEFIDKRFMFVHINVYEKDTFVYQDFRGNGREFAQELGYDFYPSSIFFDDDAEIAYAEVGYIDSAKISNEERFYKVLNYIESKSYMEMDYSDYKFDARRDF